MAVRQQPSLHTHLQVLPTFFFLRESYRDTCHSCDWSLYAACFLLSHRYRKRARKVTRTVEGTRITSVLGKGFFYKLPAVCHPGSLPGVWVWVLLSQFCVSVSRYVLQGKTCLRVWIGALCVRHFFSVHASCPAISIWLAVRIWESDRSLECHSCL